MSAVVTWRAVTKWWYESGADGGVVILKAGIQLEGSLWHFHC